MKDTHDIYGTAPSGPREETEVPQLPAGINRRSVHRNWLISGSLFVVTMISLAGFLYFLDQRLESAGESPVVELPEGDLAFLPALNSNTTERVQELQELAAIVEGAGEETNRNDLALTLTGVGVPEVALMEPLDAVEDVRELPAEDPDATDESDDPEKNVARMMAKLGEDLYKKKSYQEAARSLRLALKRDPDLTEARELLGVVLLAAGDEPEAIDVYGELISRNPFRASYYNNLALARIRLDQEKAAERDLLEALRLQSDFSDAKLNLGLLYFRRGAYRDARHYLSDESLQRKYRSHPGIHYGLGVSNLELGNYDRARRDLQEVVRLLPERAGPYFYIARSYALEEDDANALAWLKLGSDHGDETTFADHTAHPAFDRVRSTERFKRMAR